MGSHFSEGSSALFDRQSCRAQAWPARMRLTLHRTCLPIVAGLAILAFIGPQLVAAQTGGVTDRHCPGFPDFLAKGDGSQDYSE